MENHRDELPNLNHSGNRAINEILHQIEHNPKWTVGERAWFEALLHYMVDQFMSYEEAVQAAEMRNMRQPDFLGDMVGRSPDDYEDD